MRLKALVYDIETSEDAWLRFSHGKQVLSHKDLLNIRDEFSRIICIQYADLHTKKCRVMITKEYAYIIEREGKKLPKYIDVYEDTKTMIEEFDSIVEQYDTFIGKNNKGFDDKHLGGQRWLHQATNNKLFSKKSQDLQQQFKKFLKVQSCALDHMCKLIGTGGKIETSKGDWDRIYKARVFGPIVDTYREYVPDELFNPWLEKMEEDMEGAANSLLLMCKYGKKDCIDTCIAIQDAEPYVDFKTYSDNFEVCSNCDSKNLRKWSMGFIQGKKVQRYMCNECGTTRGNYRTLLKSGKEGKFN